MRRVLIYRSHLLPISETFVYNQAMYLSRYEPVFFGARLQPTPRLDLPADRTFVLNRSGNRLLEAAFKGVGIVPDSAIRWIESMRPSLIHAHFGPDGLIAARLARRLALPLVVSFHGTDATMKDSAALTRSHLTHKLYAVRRPMLVRSTSRAIAQSEFLREILLDRHGFSAANVALVRHGVDVKLFRPSPQVRHFGRVLYVGRLVELKGLSFLIRALRIVRRHVPQASLTIIGDGPKRREYMKLAAEELGQGFEFLGSQPPGVVRQHLERAHVFSMPSITMPTGEAESLGLVFLEAMSTGLPVVSFSTGGIPEVVIDGTTGFLVRQRDTLALAARIRLLMEDASLYRRMSDSGRDRVEKYFNLDSQVPKLESVYDDVLEEHELVARQSRVGQFRHC